MRVANLSGRAVLLSDTGAIDIETASDGRFGPSLAALYDEWDGFCTWAPSATGHPQPIDVAELGSPSPRPRQSFGIGLNYAKHAAESGSPIPDFPLTFTKFPSCIAGPISTVELESETVDYEVELVVIVGRRAHRVRAADAWSHVAGVCIGQDLSDRVVQKRPPIPQFSLGKSFPGFGPMGPWLTTIDDLDNPDDLALSCSLNGEVMQDSRTSDLIFSVPQLFEELSAITPFLPGDVIFTGTPEGVGQSRTPPRFVRPGDVLVSTLGGVGSITTTFR